MKMSLVTMLMLQVLAGPALAQQKAESPKPRPPVTALKLQVVLSRHEGDRKVTSRPYTMLFSTDKKFTLRQGTEQPIPVQTFEKDGREATSFQYKNVGASLEFTAEALEGGRYLVSFNIEDSSFGPDIAVTPTIKAPAFNTHRIHGSVVMRDGETVPFSSTHTTAADVSKIEMTLNVMK